jgi:hypothetical protein
MDPPQHNGVFEVDLDPLGDSAVKLAKVCLNDTIILILFTKRHHRLSNLFRC